MTKLKIKCEFTEAVLGTLSGNPEVTKEFIISKGPEAKRAEESEVIDASQELTKATTVFPRDDKGRFLWDYQFKGFLKEAIGVLTELGQGNDLSKFTFKRVVDSAIFVNPRRIYLTGGEPYFIERPLRAETMQGDRVALARSEALPAGTTFEAEITILTSTNPKSKFKSLTADLVHEAIKYGELKGLGQWRNGSFGRFKTEISEA